MEATLTNPLCTSCKQETHPSENFEGRCYDCAHHCPECGRGLGASAFFMEEIDVSDDDHRGRRYAMAAFLECPDCGINELEG